jgi:membrane protease YdiL (CAAX protease family)
MSNDLALAQQQVTAGWMIFLGFATLMALLITHAIGVFSRRTLPEFDRLGPAEHPGTLALIFFAALVAWIYTPVFYIRYRGIPATTQGTYALSPRDQVAIGAIGSLMGLAVLIIGNQTFREQGLRRLGLAWRRLRSAIPQGVLGIALVLPLLAWVTIFTMIAWRLMDLTHPEKHELLEILDKTHDPKLATLLVITAVLIAPVYEELLFRGHLQTLLRYFLRRPWPAILLSSAAFALVHPWWTQPPIFFLALCLGYAYERTNNLWVPILIHALFNATSVVISVFVHT